MILSEELIFIIKLVTSELCKIKKKIVKVDDIKQVKQLFAK